jgi:hypothetical protein
MKYFFNIVCGLNDDFHYKVKNNPQSINICDVFWATVKAIGIIFSMILVSILLFIVSILMPLIAIIYSFGFLENTFNPNILELCYNALFAEMGILSIVVYTELYDKWDVYVYKRKKYNSETTDTQTADDNKNIFIEAYLAFKNKTCYKVDVSKYLGD